MSRAFIDSNGVWTRTVPQTWKQNSGEWRTAIYRTTLHNPRLRRCVYILEGGPTVTIPVEQMRQALRGIPTLSNNMVSPFNINPYAKTVAGYKVTMS